MNAVVKKILVVGGNGFIGMSELIFHPPTDRFIDSVATFCQVRPFAELRCQRALK